MVKTVLMGWAHHRLWIIINVNLRPFLPKSLALSLQLSCNKLFSQDNPFTDTHIVMTAPKRADICLYLSRCSKKKKNLTPVGFGPFAVVHVSHICKRNSQMPNA